MKLLLALVPGVCFSPLLLLSQNASTQDCLGAIPVCQQIYQETESPEGTGQHQEVNGAFNCMGEETNSVWYTFTVDQSGDFGFLLTPNDLSDDYDWALFDITNASCEDLFSNPDLIVSCNAAGGTGCNGVTGANGGSTFDLQGFNCGNNPPGLNGGFSPYNALVPVEAGDTYVLCVSNWTGSPNGYTLDFGLSTDIGIFDETPPLVETIDLPEDCGEDVIAVAFSEFIQCNSIDNTDFSLEGPGGPYALDWSSVNCGAGGNFSKVFFLTVDPPLSAIGDFTLSFEFDGSTEALDLCSNPAAAQTYTFSTGEIFFQLDLGEDLVLCEGETTQLDPGLEDVGYLWQDGSSGPTYEVSAPGWYAVTVSNDCGNTADSVLVTYEGPLPALTLGPDTLLCPGETLNLDASLSGALAYQWQNDQDTPQLEVTQAGTYAVTVTGHCSEVQDEIMVDYFPAVEATLDYVASVCVGDSLLLDVNSFGATYQWQDGSTDPFLTVDQAGTYGVTITTQCETIELEADIIEVTEPPTLALATPVSLCLGDSLVLDLSEPGAVYAWSDGSAGPVLVIETGGTYAVTVTNGCGADEGSVQVAEVLPVSLALPADTFLCPGEALRLDVTDPHATYYFWQDNSTEPTFLITGPGRYAVRMGNDCGEAQAEMEVTECEVCDVYIPNAFSPNNDGFNDHFGPLSDCDLLDFQFTIYDRWGGQVFRSEDPGAGWDGRYRGKLAAHGVYLWVMNFAVTEDGKLREIERTGDVSLLR